MSVTRRNGRWQARYRDETGRQHSKMFDRKIDGTHWEADELAKIGNGSWIDPRSGKVTFKEYADDWLAIQPLRPTTLARYEQSLRLNIYPRLGNRPISSVRPSHVQAMIAALSDHLSASSVRLNVVVTSGIFKAAVLDRRLASNPCLGVKLPEVHPDRIEIMTTAQVVALQEAMPPEWRPIVLLGVGAGLRQGEALGVVKERIDFLRLQLRVDKQLINLPGEQPRLAPVKTKTSVRTIPLPQVVIDALAAHLAGYPTDDGWQPALIFPATSRQQFSKIWRAATKRAGLPQSVTYHSLRHYYASLLIRHGESVKAVQERLGHSSAVTTLNIYSHLWPDSDDRTRAAVDEVLGASVHSACTAPEATG
jgi:integrase